MLLENPTVVDVPQVKGFAGQMTSRFGRVKLDASSDSYAPLCNITDARKGSWFVEVGEFSELLWGRIPQENTCCVMVVVVSSSSYQDPPMSICHDMSTESLGQA